MKLLPLIQEEEKRVPIHNKARLEKTAKFVNSYLRNNKQIIIKFSDAYKNYNFSVGYEKVEIVNNKWLDDLIRLPQLRSLAPYTHTLIIHIKDIKGKITDEDHTIKLSDNHFPAVAEYTLMDSFKDLFGLHKDEIEFKIPSKR